MPLVMQGTKASVAMVLIYLCRNIQVSAPKNVNSFNSYIWRSTVSEHALLLHTKKQSNTELIHLYIKEPSNGINYLLMPKILNALTYLRII